jgi:hypothetical protein
VKALLALAALVLFNADSWTGVNVTGVTYQLIGGGSGPQCSDGIDNDSDGLIDYPLDPSCDSAGDNDEAHGWSQVKIGGGGFLTGIDISPDGLSRCARTDTYGAYCWNAQTNIWVQVARPSTMPVGSFSPGGTGDGFGHGGGVYEIRSAPSLSSRLYMAKGGSVFRSDNRGASWSLTTFTPVDPDTSMGANDAGRLKFATQKMAISPSDPNVVLVGLMTGGLFRSADGGTSWANIATVPTTGLVSGIAFGSGTTVWLTSGAAGSQGAYKSVDNGVTFALQAGGPNGVTGNAWGGVAAGTDYWLTYGTYASGAKKVWHNAAGVWTDCTANDGGAPGSPQGIALNAAGTRLAISDDQNGAGRSGVRMGPATTCGPANWDTAFTQGNVTLSCPTANWLCQATLITTGGFGASIGMTKGGLAFDPSADRLWLSGGMTMWWMPASAVAPGFVWTEQTRGIEQLVTNKVVIAPNGADIPLAANWDFGQRRITNPEVYQATYTPPNTRFIADWGMDYSSADPNFIVTTSCWTGSAILQHSINNGASWVVDPNMPPGASTNCDTVWGNGGDIAVSTNLNWVWQPADNGLVPVAGYFTNNAGGSWTKIVLPAPMTDDRDATHGWPAVYGGKQLNRHNLTADRVLPNTFYMSIYTQGVYRSTNGGSTWALVSATNALNNDGNFDDTGLNATLKAVPGKAGELFFSSGQQDNTGGNVPQINPFYRSINGGVTWTKVAGMYEVYSFGFGKVVNNYPRILVVGWYNNQYGVWQSDNNAASWTRLGNEYANDVFDSVGGIDGDKTGDRVFLAMRGSGMAYYNTPPPISTLAQQCNNGIDDDGDGTIDWFGKDGGGDPGCPTPDWPLGECQEPECAPASNAPGVGLASISPAVPAWPGAFKNPGVGGCPSSNILSTPNVVYSYCAFAPGRVTINAANITCYGCLFRETSGGDNTTFAIWLEATNFRMVYSRVQPTSCGTARVCDPPWTYGNGYQFALYNGFAPSGSWGPWTVERSIVKGYGNALNIDGSGCSLARPCTVRGTLIGYPRDRGVKANGECPSQAGPDCDHTDGLGCTSNPTCTGDYVTSTGNVYLGVYKGTTNGNANTNALALQEGTGDNTGYDHLMFTRNYVSGWNTAITPEEGPVNNTNGLFANNYFGTEWKPGTQLIFTWGQNLGSGQPNVWANNKWNVVPPSNGGTWTYPIPSDDGKFWYSDSGLETAKNSTDFNGNTLVPYPEPQCNDGLDNDGDGNIDYPWDPECTSVWDNGEGTAGTQ